MEWIETCNKKTTIETYHKKHNDNLEQVWMKLTASQKTALTKLRIENKSYKAVSIGDHRKTGQRSV